MKKLLLLLSLLASPALAANPATYVGDASYTALSTDVRIYTTATFTAGRTIILPFAGATCIGQNCQPAAFQLEINDVAGAFSQQFPLTIAPATGDTINNNSANLIISGPKARILLFPTSGGNWQSQVLGDYVTSGLCLSNATTATITVTIAAPGVVTWTAHGFTGACPVVFTTSGALPTGITSGTTYWIVPSTITTNTFQIATTVANALAGTAITTSGSQSGTQTGTAGAPLTSTTAANITGVSLSQGEWECRSKVSRALGASTSVTKLSSSNSGTTATMVAQGSNAATYLSTAANVMGVGGTDTTVAIDRQSFTSTSNLFLVANDTFSVSTDNAFGAITCRRVH